MPRPIDTVRPLCRFGNMRCCRNALWLFVPYWVNENTEGWEIGFRPDALKKIYPGLSDERVLEITALVKLQRESVRDGHRLLRDAVSAAQGLLDDGLADAISLIAQGHSIGL